MKNLLILVINKFNVQNLLLFHIYLNMKYFNFILKVHSSEVELIAHNDTVVGSNPTEPILKMIRRIINCIFILPYVL